MPNMMPVMAKMLQDYSKVKVQPLSWEDGAIDEIITHFLMEDVNVKASPGIPLAIMGKTNGLILKDHRSLVINLVKARLWKLSNFECSHLSAEEKVKQGFCDPIRLFVKDEPHPLAKLVDGRLRLIMSVSLVDQLVERVLHSRLNKKEIESWRDIPSKAGSSMSMDEDVAEIRRWLKSRAQPASSDISGFDWSVKQWQLLFDAQFRTALSLDCSPEWRHAVYQRALCLSHSVFSLSDGTMIAQQTPGIQKSGSYNTTSTNSHIRVALAYLAGSEQAIALGDDSVEDYVDGAEARYVALGHPLKSYDKCIGEATFCSTVIRFDGTHEPVTWDRTLYRFLESREKDESRIRQLAFVLKHSPHIGRIIRWIGCNYSQLSGWLVSAEKLKEIVDQVLDDTQKPTTSDCDNAVTNSPEVSQTSRC